MSNRSTFVEFSGEPAVKPISISPTIERHRLTALINTNLCEPYTATISIEANSERDALVLFEWFKQQAEAAAPAPNIEHAAAALSSPDSEPMLSARLHHPSGICEYTYVCDLGRVECRAEPTSDGRYAAVVMLVHPTDGGRDVLRHMCPGSDVLESDAAARARAWAAKNFPPRALTTSRAA